MGVTAAAAHTCWHVRSPQLQLAHLHGGRYAAHGQQDYGYGCTRHRCTAPRHSQQRNASMIWQTASHLAALQVTDQ